jgi:hypothetical protein
MVVDLLKKALARFGKKAASEMQSSGITTLAQVPGQLTNGLSLQTQAYPGRRG